MSLFIIILALSEISTYLIFHFFICSIFIDHFWIYNQFYIAHLLIYINPKYTFTYVFFIWWYSMIVLIFYIQFYVAPLSTLWAWTRPLFNLFDQVI